MWVSRADCCWAKEMELASQTRPPWPGKSGFSRRRCDPADHFAPPQSSPLPFALVSWPGMIADNAVVGSQPLDLGLNSEAPTWLPTSPPRWK